MYVQIKAISIFNGEILGGFPLSQDATITVLFNIFLTNAAMEVESNHQCSSGEEIN